MGRDGSIVFLMKVMNIFCKKHIKMENKEQDFINRYKNVQESIVKAMDKALERAIGNKAIDFEKCEGNYLDVYPLIGAVLQKELRSVLGENVNKSIRIGQNENRSIKKVLEEIEDKAIESRYTDMYDWQRRDLSKEDLFEYAEEMRKCLDKIFNLAIDERLK